jgi:predicted permease
VCGAIAGCVAGVWGARALISLSPGGLPRADDLANAPLLSSLLDWRLLGFMALAALVTGLLFGIAPALHLSRADVSASLKESGGRGVSSRKAARTRDALVVVEIALALMLLVGATLLIRTVAGLRDVKPGFDTTNILTLQTSLAGSKYETSRQVETLMRTMTQRIDALPGVQAAAMAISLPTEDSVDLPFRIEGRPLQGSDLYHGDEQWRSISPEYFKAFGIPLLRGRVFTERDSGGTAPVVLVNDAFAKKLWPNADPIGQRMTIGKGLGPEFEDPTREVVGIVGNVRENGLDRDPPPIIYVPGAQVTDGLTRLGNSLIPAKWIVRTSGISASLSSSIQQEFLAVDSQLPVARVRTMEAVVGSSIQQQNFNMLLLSIFGGIALVLAAIGIYGLMSYSVEQGTRDIGVRLALGAERGAILRMVVGRGMTLAGIGLAAGLAAAFGASRLLARMLYGVKPTDPASYLVVAAALGTIALLACYLPARRATRVDPMVALRTE